MDKQKDRQTDRQIGVGPDVTGTGYQLLRKLSPEELKFETWLGSRVIQGQPMEVSETISKAQVREVAKCATLTSMCDALELEIIALIDM